MMPAPPRCTFRAGSFGRHPLPQRRSQRRGPEAASEAESPKCTESESMRECTVRGPTQTLPTIRPTGGPANGLFRSSREPHHLLRRRRACRFSAAICSLLALQHAWQREVGEYAVHGTCKTDGVEEADAACAKH